jgi:hypothetical protein
MFARDDDLSSACTSTLPFFALWRRIPDAFDCKGVIQAVNGSQEREIPLHASPQGGWLRHQEIVAKPPYTAQTGWFSFPGEGKPLRPRDNRRLRDYLFDRSDTPPCGDARRGISAPVNLFTGS